MKPCSVLPTLSFTNRGEITQIHVSILASPLATRDAIRQKVIGRILSNRPDVEILFPVNEDTGDSRRLCLLLLAETSNGYRIGRDWLYHRKLTKGSSQATKKEVDELVSMVVNGLEEELAHGGCVDEYLQDQLVVFQALAEGSASVDYGNKNKNGKGKRKEVVNLHTKTVQWVAEEILGVRFSSSSNSNGGAAAAGSTYEKSCEYVASEQLGESGGY